MPESRASEADKKEETLKCGLIMPISGSPNTGYTEGHWKNIKNILERAAIQAGFAPRLVSDSDPTAIIQKSIINNVYYDNIVVCDVSSKNPNVMFELGMRLAFDKPVVIVKDSDTNYTFDIGMIQHITYPKSLAFHEIEKFIAELAVKIKSTYDDYQSSPEKHSFLRHFGEVEPQKLSSKNVDIKDFLNTMNSNIENVSNDIMRLRRQVHMLEKNNIMNNLNKEDLERHYAKQQQMIRRAIAKNMNNETDEVPF